MPPTCSLTSMEKPGRWVGTGVSLLGFFITVVSFRWDAQTHGSEGALAMRLGAALFFAPIVVGAILWASKRARICHRRLKVALKKIRSYDRLEGAVAAWQERAEEAESKLDDWDAQAVREGRRRAFFEMAASLTIVEFDQIELGFDGSEVIIGARISAGSPPLLGAIFMVESRTLGAVLMSVRCVGYREEDGVCLFAPDVLTAISASDLTLLARTTRELPAHHQIRARPQADDFTNER